MSLRPWMRWYRLLNLTDISTHLTPGTLIFDYLSLSIVKKNAPVTRESLRL